MNKLLKRFIIFLIPVLGLGLGIYFTMSAMSACGSGDCLVEGENCTMAYLENAGKVGWSCCGDMGCYSGPISGVNICQ